MRRWIAWAACLYPAEWRRCYGAEFDALLDDARLQWRDLADVVRGAVIMRMTAWNSYWKVGAMAGLAGAILAGGVSLLIRDQYAAVAALQLEDRTDAQGAPAKGTRHLAQALGQLELEILGRDNLIALIRNPHLDLYREERRRMPVEKVAEEMQRKHVRVSFYSVVPGRMFFRIFFEYPDRFKAREVVLYLVSALKGKNIILHQGAPGSVMSVLEEPRVPVTPRYPVRRNIALAGAIAGMIMGLMSLKLWRRTRDYAVVTMTIPKGTRQFVDTQVGPGGYASVSDYIRELIRADEQRKSQAGTGHSGM